jgi:hypothetical protein
MTDVEKTREQVTIFRQMRILQKNHYNDELEWLPLEYFYIVNIFNAENNEDYELCQAIKDSAEKHGIRLHG